MASSPAAPSVPGSGVVRLKKNPYQEAFLAALQRRLTNGRRAYRRLALFAGRRGGKTRIGALGTVLEAVRAPHQTIWVCTGSYPKLHDYVLPAIDLVLPRSYLAKPFNQTHCEYELKNGTRIHGRSLDDINRARGPGLDLAWIDEARDVSQLAWRTMVPALVDKHGSAIITTTPAGFDWCYESFWKPAAEAEPGYWACKYRSIDNPGLDKDEVAATRREMDPLFFQQEYEAEFVSFTGAIYGDVLAQQLLEDDRVREFIPEWPHIDITRPVLIGLDPGADHPFAATILVATTRGLVCVGEYLARNAAMMLHALALRGKLHALGLSSADTWAIDRSQKQAQIELSQHGIYTVAAENDVVGGIQRVKSWLIGKRLWIVRSRCPKLVQQMFSYRWAENTDTSGQARRERVVKTNDDLPDALRYAIMSWPELPYPEAPSLLRDLSTLPDDHRWSLDRQQRMEHPEEFDADEDPLDDAGMTESATPLGDFWG